MIYPNLKRQPAKKLIEEAARNLLIKDIEIKRIDEFVGFVDIFTAKINGKDISGNYNKSWYDLINAGIGFFDKVRLTYGIFNPLEALIAWLAIIEEANPKSILEQDYKIEYFRSWVEAVETRFLEKPSENIQRKMGLPIVNCAITKTNMHIDENMDFSKILSRRIKPGYRHFILVDSSATMRGYVHGTNERITGYLSAILLEILYKADKAFIFFHDRKTTIRKIAIESEQDKKKFWSEIDRRLFSSELVLKNSFLSVFELLESKEYNQCKSNNEKICIDIITDKDFNESGAEAAVLAKKMNLDKVRVNVFLLEPKDLFLSHKESNIEVMINKTKKKSLFILDKNQLVCYTSANVL